MGRTQEEAFGSGIMILPAFKSAHRITATFKDSLKPLPQQLIYETLCEFTSLFSVSVKRRSFIRMEGGFSFTVKGNPMGSSRALRIRDSALEFASGICIWVQPEIGVHNLFPMVVETNQAT